MNSSDSVELARPSVPHHGVPEEVDEHRKPAGQRHPDDRPPHRLAKLHHVPLAMEDAEVEGEHREYEDIEQNPEDPV